MIKAFLFILIVLSSCASINNAPFEEYNDAIKDNTDSLERKISNISDYSKDIYILEVSLELEEIQDIRIERNNSFEYNKERMFFDIIQDTLNKVERFNEFLLNYSGSLHALASDDLNVESSIISMRNSLESVSNDLNISNEITNRSLSAISTILNISYERKTYKLRKELIHDLAESNSQLIDRILSIYIDIIHDLEFSLYDYYSRTFFYLEDVLFYKEDFLERRAMAQELYSLNNDYYNSLQKIKTLENNFQLLKEYSGNFHEILLSKDFGESEELLDFVERNYEFYEGLN